ncbi:MAG: PAS domain S-box protein [Chlorobi bacterium]|nr:PAS domain S-box protein [Chlorobiota bacterium]MCI0715511.1 PAS domain S-box protein [Chlorobiota bacterium]
MKRKIKPEFSNLANQLPLEKFIPAAFLIFLVCFIILSIVTYKNISSYKDSIEWVDHAQEVIKKTDQLNIYLSQMLLFRRGYILMRDQKYLDSYNENRLMLQNEITEVREIVKSNSNQERLVLQIDSLASLHILLLDSSITLFKLEDKVTEEQTKLATASQHTLEQIYDISLSVKNEEIELLNSRQAKANESSLNIQIFIISTSLFAFVIIGLSLFISNRLIKNKNTAERLLQKSYEELEDKVEERTAELKSANAQLVQEIEARIKTENSLRESEERFRVMADSSPVMIWMSSRNKHCNYFNKSWLDFTGRTLQQELGNGWAEGIHPEDLKNCLETYILAFERMEPFEMEFRLRNTKGEFRWVLDKAIPRYEGDEFAGYIGSCIDIHLRKTNEKYLKIQHTVAKTLEEAKSFDETLSGVLEDICTGLNWDFGILWVVENGRLKPASTWAAGKRNTREYTAMYDSEFSLKKGSGLPGIVWKNSKSMWIQDIRIDHNFIRKNDALKMGWISAFAVPISNGRDIISVLECFSRNRLSPMEDLLEVLEAVGRQIGNYLERKKAENELKKSYSELEDRVKDRTIELANTLTRLLTEIENKEKIQGKLKLFAHAIKGIKECVYITDLESRTIFINSAFESVYGYYEEELLNKRIPVVFSNTIDDKTKDELLVRTLRGGWKGELKNRRKDDSEFIVYLSTSVIRNDEGRAEAIVGICQDITDLKTNETLIKKQNSLLKLLNDVILITNKSFDLKNSISYAINKVCQYTKWDVGHCYLKSEDGTLVSSGLWNYNLGEEYISLKELFESAVFVKGEGLPGTAFEEQKAYWVKLSELEGESYKRLKFTGKTGLKTGIWIPVMKQTEAIGVLEFFKADDEPLDSEILECISNIGVELGSIVERSEILDKIREGEKHFKAVADTANEAIITSNKEGNIIYINKSVENIFGYNASELLSQKLTALMPEALKERHLRAFEKTVSTGNSNLIGRTIELAGRRKDGTEFPIELSLSKWHLNNEVFFTGMLRDISVRKQIECELIEKQKMLEQSQKIAKLGSWEADLITGKQVWSDELYRIHGFRPGEIEQDYKILFSLIHPVDTGKVEKLIAQFEKKPEPAVIDYRIVTKNGRLKYLNVELLIEFDSNNKPLKLYGSVQDITDIKLVEEELRKTNARLIEAQKDAINNEKLAALGRFSSGIAHEIRNPLANISALAQLLAKAKLDEKSQKHLKYILVNTDIADKIIRDLLNFASPEDLVFKEENLNEILDNIIGSVKPRCAENKIEISKAVQKNLPWLFIDKIKLENALMNFVSNSIDAMPRGGKLNIDVKQSKGSNELVMSISDTGVGISQENLDKIFEPFFTTKTNGTGLGLGLAYQTVKAHQGILNIRSTEGTGTTVEIKLPINHSGKNTNNRR